MVDATPDETPAVLREVAEEQRQRKSYKCQKIVFAIGSGIFCGGMVYFAYFCSNRRNQAVSFYFTMSFIFGEVMIDIFRRNLITLWNHPEMKHSYPLTYWQVFYWWCVAALFWISIHPYAQTLGEVPKPYIMHKTDFEIAESNFYNVISMCELAGVFIDTLMAVSIVYIQIAYHFVCRDEEQGAASELVTIQMREVQGAIDMDEKEIVRRTELINLRYQVAKKVLGRRAVNLTHAMSYFYMRRPSRKAAIKRASVLNNSEVTDPKNNINRSTFMNSTQQSLIASQEVKAEEGVANSMY